MSSNIHHAYLLVGEADAAESFLHDFWLERGVKLQGSPDFFVFAEALFGIEEARKVSSSASRKAFIERKIFFIAPERITEEAQNALLKTFEDPYENTHFFLAVREEELILPTLRSRVMVARVGGNEGGLEEVHKFLAASPSGRLVFAKKFADNERNISIFLDKLLHILREKGGREDSIKKVYEARRYSDDRAASRRLILEHLALVI